MSDEIVYALLNNKIKKLAKKVEEGGLPEGTVIPTKLSDLENDLYGSTELLVGECTAADFIVKEMEDEEGTYTIIFANLSGDAGVKEAVMADATLTGYLKTIDGITFPLEFGRDTTNSNYAEWVISLNGAIGAVLNIGFNIDPDTFDVIESDYNSCIVLYQPDMLSLIDTVKITTVTYKKIPAEYVESESDFFIAKQDVTPYSEISNAYQDDKLCYAEVQDPRNGGIVRVPITEYYEDWSAGTFTGENGYYIKVEINSENAWDINSGYILPRTGMVDRGKFLRVDINGNWVAEAVPSAEGGSY